MTIVIGSKGMLGSDLMELLGGGAKGLDIDEIDITDLDSVLRTILPLKPKTVINCAAYTDVDGCESNKEKAMMVNGEGVAHLAFACRELNALLVHVSTDYVFDGKKGAPYIEDDPTTPLNLYGESKLAGEMNAAFSPEYLIVRTQWLYGLNGKNFVETMLKIASEKSEIAVVNDQIGSPTWTVDLAKAIIALIDNNRRGIYHVANSGFCSWNDFAKAIFEECGKDVKVNYMTTKELNRPALRPLYSTLSCEKLIKDTKFKPQNWREALKNYLKLRGER